MREYVTPDCRVRELDLETSFVTGASGGGFPVDPADPFGTGFGIMEEDGYE